MPVADLTRRDRTATPDALRDRDPVIDRGVAPRARPASGHVRILRNHAGHSGRREPPAVDPTFGRDLGTPPVGSAA